MASTPARTTTPEGRSPGASPANENRPAPSPASGEAAAALSLLAAHNVREVIPPQRLKRRVVNVKPGGQALSPTIRVDISTDRPVQVAPKPKKNFRLVDVDERRKRATQNKARKVVRRGRGPEKKVNDDAWTLRGHKRKRVRKPKPPPPSEDVAWLSEQWRQEMSEIELENSSYNQVFAYTKAVGGIKLSADYSRPSGYAGLRRAQDLVLASLVCMVATADADLVTLPNEAIRDMTERVLKDPAILPLASRAWVNDLYQWKSRVGVEIMGREGIETGFGVDGRSLESAQDEILATVVERLRAKTLTLEQIWRTPLLRREAAEVLEKEKQAKLKAQRARLAAENEQILPERLAAMERLRKSMAMEGQKA